ncbi:hypothetical protein BB560_004256, partial [Smittium megazygosporum]
LSTKLGLKPKKKNGFLILGLPDAGKTTIWAWTSMVVNEHEMNIDAMGKNVTVFMADIPGNPKLRTQYTQYLPITKGILFLVDSSTFMQNSKDVADNILRKSRFNALESHGDEGSYQNDGFLGVFDRPFLFSHIPNQVGFIETVFQTSVEKPPVIVGTDKLTSWIIDQID